MTSQNDRNYSTFTHLSGFAGYFFPFGNIIAPLIMWTIKKKESTFIDYHGKSAVNFQLSLLFYGFMLALLIIPITIFTLGLGLIAIGLACIPYIILKFIVIITASIRANNGETYEYPFTIEFIK